MADETVTQDEAEAAVRVLLRWAGDDPDREGLLDTPGRVARSYKELFAGYEINPYDYMERTFEEVGGYDELVVLRDIPARQLLRAPHAARARARRTWAICRPIAWWASRSWPGWSTAMPAACRSRRSSPPRSPARSTRCCKPKGVGVVIEAEHACMTLRGVNTPGTRPDHQPPDRRHSRRPAHATGISGAGWSSARGRTRPPLSPGGPCSADRSC